MRLYDPIWRINQGMILLSACNYILNNVMIRRFHTDERVRSIELLLQEKIPHDPHIEYPHPERPRNRNRLRAL